MAESKKHLFTCSPAGINAALLEMGEPRFRADQICDWVFSKRVASFDDMRNVSKELRTKLSDRFTLRSMSVVTRQSSSDNLTEKWLLRTSDNHGVECVLIREQDRRTACISCSIGCAMGCAFCASARGPFVRQLTAGEILEQAAWIENETKEKLTNIVFMGTGEPFLNYEEVLTAARRLNAQEFFGIGARHITISTVGVVPGIERFAAEPEDFRLAVSLHAPNQKAREKLIPSAKKYKFQNIINALRRYCRTTRREVTIEYILIEGVNAHPNDAEQLCENLQGIPCKVNCIPINPWPNCEFSPPETRRCREFVRNIESRGIRATLRLEKGSDIAAACGQLRNRAKLD